MVTTMTRKKQRKPRFKRCSRNNHRIIATELDAKIALAYRQRKDKGENRIFPCGNHWHMTSNEQITPWE